MNYSRRVIEIVDILIRHEDYMSMSDLSEKADISKRTIFREMESVEEMLQSLGMSLVKKPRLGVRIEATVDQKNAFYLLAEDRKEDHFSQEARQSRIIIELLKNREPLKFYYFSSLLSVSEATISYDMDKVEPWFASRQITLVRKPGFGVYLEGNETQFRKAIVDFLYQHYAHQDLITLLNNESDRGPMVDTLMDKEILIKISQILGGYEDILAQKLTENAYMGLNIHLAIAVQRLMRGERIYIHPDILNGLKNDIQFEIARRIGTEIEGAFSIKFPEDELGYITMHLKGSKLKTGSIVDQDDLIISNFEMTKLTTQMIAEFKERSGYDLREDENLLIGLVSHLKPAITRLKLALEIRNPLLDQIQEMYPDIYHMSKAVSHKIEGQYGVELPPGEIGFLAMHFGAAIERIRKIQVVERKIRTGIVCASGIGTSSLLYSRLSKLFPRLDLLGQFSKEDLIVGKTDAYDLDLVVSTIQINYGTIPCIKVNPLLPKEDIEKIRHLIGLLSTQTQPVISHKVLDEMNQTEHIQKIHDMTQAILLIEEGFLIYEGIKTKSIADLIKKISNEKSEDGKLKKTLFKQLIWRDKMGSTIIHDEGVILIHIKSEAVKEIDFSIWRLEKAIQSEDGEKVDLAIVMLLPIGAPPAHTELLSRLSKALIEEEKFIHHLKNGTRAEVGQQLRRILHSWLTKYMQKGGLYDL